MIIKANHLVAPGVAIPDTERVEHDLTRSLKCTCHGLYWPAVWLLSDRRCPLSWTPINGQRAADWPV